jgi:hypothetical protein
MMAAAVSRCWCVSHSLRHQKSSSKGSDHRGGLLFGHVGVSGTGIPGVNCIGQRRERVGRKRWS